MTDASWFAVELVYAGAERQTVLVTWIAAGTSVAAAIESSGIRAAHPEIDPASARIGISGAIVEGTAQAAAGDRIEIYRPLVIDPRQSRRQRVRRRRAP